MKVKICVGTTCHLMGASALIDSIENYEETLKRKLDIEYATCFSACQVTLASPVIKIDEELLGDMTPETLKKTIISRLEKGE